MSYRDYLETPTDVVQAMILEALQSIDEKLGRLLAPTEAPAVEPAPEPTRTWRVRGQCHDPEVFASREEVDRIISSWQEPMSAGAFTHVYAGRRVEGAEEVEPGL